MAVETATYTSQLSSANPPAGDSLGQTDDHLRLIKSTILATWPNLTAAACTPTTTEINYVDGVTSSIQTQLDAKAALASPALTGTPTCPTPIFGASSTVANAEAIYNAVGGYTAGAIGSYMLAQSSSSGLGFGSVVAGASLKPVQLNTDGSQTVSTAQSGSWRCMGYANGTTVAALFLRYA